LTFPNKRKPKKTKRGGKQATVESAGEAQLSNERQKPTMENTMITMVQYLKFFNLSKNQRRNVRDVFLRWINRSHGFEDISEDKPDPPLQSELPPSGAAGLSMNRPKEGN
jgi:hypothetical protein